MADEIAQVVEMEYKGVYYLLKGSKAMIALMARAVKALTEWHHEKYLKKEGNCTWEKMQEISNGTPPILEFPKEMFEEKIIRTNPDGSVVYKSDFDLYCEKYNLRYCIMPDLNPNDDYIPVAVPAQDMGIHKEQIKAVMSRRIAAEEDTDKALDARIVLAKEKILNATSDEEKEEAEKELAMLLDAKEQNKNLLSESKEKMDKDNVLDFAEYLKQGEGSLFETDPEAALKQENVCGIVREYTPYDCMWPVRDESLVPESGEVFYSQRSSDDKIHMIRRKFNRDEQGMIYSEYMIRMPGTSEVKVFSDYGLSREDWQKQIPAMLEAGGLMNEQPTAVVKSEERFLKYQEFVEENFKKATDEVTEVSAKREYSSEEAEKLVESHNHEVIQRSDYEDAQYTTFPIHASCLMADKEGHMCMEISEGLVQGGFIKNVDGMTVNMMLRDNETYSVLGKDGVTKQMSGAEIIDIATRERKEILSKAISHARK